MPMVHKALWVIICLQVTPLLLGQRDESSRELRVDGAGQNEFTRINGAEDRDIPLPLIGDASLRKDPSAIQELIEYLNVVGVKEWNGLNAKGVFLQAAGDGGDARLTIGSSDQARLDIVTANGTSSTRINGRTGTTFDADGKRIHIPPTTAKTGLLSFPKPFTADFGRLASAIVDRGEVNVDGETLHRITVEEPVLLNEGPPATNAPSVTDFYFDPVKHLLRLTASFVQLDSNDRELYLIVSRYSDYRRDTAMLMPHSISQTLNGQHQWTLQLTKIDLQSPSDRSYFEF